jgi:hypothetical protein
VALLISMAGRAEMKLQSVWYLSYQLALNRNNGAFQVSIFDRNNNPVGSTMLHSEAGSALDEAKRYIYQLVGRRR